MPRAARRDEMEILYEDKEITVAIKPVGMLSEQTAAGDGFADLLAARNEGGYVGVIHRLDRGVGGVMVYARTPKAAAKLSAAVQARSFGKEYLAVVHGKPAEESDTLQDLLFHDRQKNKTFTVARERRGVKPASLTYTRLATVTHPEYGEISLLRVLLHTGRTHQIRVQFSSRAMPLVGDGKYGARDRCDIALFCRALCFPHPTTAKPMHFEARPRGGVWDMMDESLTVVGE